MPGFDGTGPRGMGPMAGGGRGFCAVPVSDFGRRCFGRGNGRGYGNMYFAPVAIDEAGLLKEQLDMIQQRLETLEKAKGSKE